ncbi:MAG TPA: hypothetical protein VF621_18540 [Pyrinomonadaceae bacterium]
MLQNSRQNSHTLRLTLAALLLLSAAATLRAQSSEAQYPTPVFAGELSGRIAPRDVGDARRTRHFYTFRGTEGDLVVNLETNNLTGGVDVFTAAGFRPLVKFTLFGDPARLSKSFYLRKEETLVLRVEARAVGDAEGTYRVTFGGSFLQAPPELANQPTPEAPTLSSAGPRPNTRRVTATGARIEEPRAEPTPAEETAAAAPTSAPTPTPGRATGRRSNTPRRGRDTRPAPPRARARDSAAQPARPDSAEPKPSEDTTAAAPAPAEKPAPAPRRRAPRNTRRGSTRESAEARSTEPAAQPPAAAQPAPTPPVPSQRLIIVTKDGETLERDMSGVRRVTVENNQVVILGRDGKTTRRPLANILRMSIEP